MKPPKYIQHYRDFEILFKNIFPHVGLYQTKQSTSQPFYHILSNVPKRLHFLYATIVAWEPAHDETICGGQICIFVFWGVYFYSTLVTCAICENGNLRTQFFVRQVSHLFFNYNYLLASFLRRFPAKQTRFVKVESRLIVKK